MHSKLVSATLFCLALLLTSCSHDRDGERIIGSWKLDRAMRNDNITNSLEGMYMVFNDDKSFDSNILGDSSSFSAQIENGKIKVDHDIIQLFYIEELTDSTMKLQFDINDDELLLVFIK